MCDFSWDCPDLSDSISLWCGTDYQAVTKADKEDNKTIQTFQTEDGDGNAVTVAAVQDTLYVTAKDAGIYSKPGEDTEKLADVSLGDELSRSACSPTRME